jgi:hypothetical protein
LALDDLLYVAPSVSLSNNVNTVEVGTTITSITFTWTYNKTMTSASINNGVGAVALSNGSDTITGSWASNETWTISASDGTNTATASTSIGFYNQRYWGVNASATLTTAQILALGSSEFATSFGKSINYNCAATNVYPYYAYPAAWGSPSNVTVGGLAFSDFTLVAQSFTNASGHVSTYNVIRFNNVQSGANIAVVWA